MTTTIQTEQTYNYQELPQTHDNLIEERDELLLKLAQERLRNSDLQQTVNMLESQLMEVLNGGGG